HDEGHGVHPPPRPVGAALPAAARRPRGGGRTPRRVPRPLPRRHRRRALTLCPWDHPATGITLPPEHTVTPVPSPSPAPTRSAPTPRPAPTGGQLSALAGLSPTGPGTPHD